MRAFGVTSTTSVSGTPGLTLSVLALVDTDTCCGRSRNLASGLASCADAPEPARAVKTVKTTRSQTDLERLCTNGIIEWLRVSPRADRRGRSGHRRPRRPLSR